MTFNNELIDNIKYFFSLVLEDYVGDMDELLEMADITEKDVESFLSSRWELRNDDDNPDCIDGKLWRTH